MQLELIEQKLQKEHKEMQVLKEKLRNQNRIANELESDYNTRCAPELETILTNILSDDHQIESIITGATLDEIDSTKRVEKIRQYLKNGHFDDVSQYIIQLDATVGHYDEWKSLQVHERVLYFNTLLKSYLFDDYVSLNSLFFSMICLQYIYFDVQMRINVVSFCYQQSELEKQVNVVGFLEDALEFSQAIAGAVPKLEEMLMSTTISDALEAIEFFKTGYLFDIKGTENGLKLMLRLLYIINTGQEKNEKSEAVLRAYHQILFVTDSTNRYFHVHFHLLKQTHDQTTQKVKLILTYLNRAHHLKVVDNLCKFLQYISTGEYVALQLMIKNWVATDDINSQTVNILFEGFTLKLPDKTETFARCCMELLILISK